MTIGQRIKNIRDNLNMSQVDFADKINVSKQTLYKYENNIITNIPSDKIEAIASIGKISPSYIMGWDSTDVSLKKKKGVTINVLERVAAGIPIEAMENIIDTEEIPEELAKTGEFFGLKIHGDSMEPKISEGDIVIVRKQEDAESGQIIIATVNGTDATCKRLRKYHDGIELISNNPSYNPMFFTNEEIENEPVKIIGKVVELRAKF
ncbi:MAG: helix-turn-helix domain-containing protein [Lachnospiraceae bacterium]|nr:helix-turn-helix domain-containing protein [Lachnospiraceae bacterium]